MGVARRVGRDMSYWIIPFSVQPIAETNVQNVTRDDIFDPNIAVQIKAFDQALIERLDNINFIINDFDGFGVEYEGSDMPQWDTWDLAYDEKKTTSTETEYGEMMEEPHREFDDIGSFNKYISVVVKLENETNNGGNISTVKRRATDKNIYAIGREHKNQIMDTLEYEVELE